MDFAVREVAPQVWRVDIAGTVRIVRYRAGTITFAPWDICTAEGGRLWAAPSLESAFRWIEARAGLPSEVLLTEGLLNQIGSNRSLATPEALESMEPEEGANANMARPLP